MVLQRVTVTGGQGFLGAYVIKELLGKGSVVESLDLKEAPDILAQAQGCAGSWVKKLCYHSSQHRQVKDAILNFKPTAVIHLAGVQIPTVRSNAPLGVAVNLLGTINVFEAVKALAEQEGAGKVVPVGLRPLTIFGVGREIGLTSGPTKAVKAAILGRRFEIEVSGTTGFHHVADVARLFVETLGGAVRQPGAHVCGIKGHVVSYEEFLKEAAKIVPEVAKLAWIKPQAPEVPIHGDVDEAPLHMLTQRETIHMTLKEAIAEMVRRYQDLKARGKLRDQDLGQEPPCKSHARCSRAMWWFGGLLSVCAANALSEDYMARIDPSLRSWLRSVRLSEDVLLQLEVHQGKLRAFQDHEQLALEEEEVAQLRSVFPSDAFAPEALLSPIGPEAWDAKRQQFGKHGLDANIFPDCAVNNENHLERTTVDS
eukprot:g16050.t1